MSELYRIRVPDVGEGVAEVEIAAWQVAVGDSIAEDQILAEVMTDKATVEIPSPVAGVVRMLGGEVGDTLAVGADLLRIDTGAAPAATAPRSTAAPAAAPTARTPAPAAVPPATPRPRAPGPAAAPPSGQLQRVIASPALRARAWSLGVDLARVTPGGPSGRVMQADLDAYLAAGGATAAATAAPAAAAAAPTPETRTQRIVGLRRRIAERMQESKRRIPHYSYVEELDVGAVEDLRARLNAQGEPPRLTLLPFLVRAIVVAVRDWPQVNAHLDDEAGLLTLHGPVHVGIATQTDAGLMVPVLRDAQALDLRACAAGIAHLAELTRQGRATRDQLSGSTITLTSLGRLGGIVSTPVINRPEVAIVGVNRIVMRPVWRDGNVVGRPMMNLSSSFDHRVVDGAVAAGFVQRLRELIEQPALLFVD